MHQGKPVEDVLRTKETAEGPVSLVCGMGEPGVARRSDFRSFPTHAYRGGLLFLTR